jgi:hypothetical protein
MSKHKNESGWLYWFIRKAQVERHYLLNQWHFFKKPALKRWIAERRNNV